MTKHEVLNEGLQQAINKSSVKADNAYCWLFLTIALLFFCVIILSGSCYNLKTDYNKLVNLKLSNDSVIAGYKANNECLTNANLMKK